MRWKPVSLALVAAVAMTCLFIGLVLGPDNSSKRTLPDGTVLVLSGLRIGRTNIYSHGTLLSKTIGRFAPSNGLAICGFKLQRPEKISVIGREGSEVLSAELTVLRSSRRPNSFESPPFYRKYRWLVYGEDQFTFVKEFNDSRMYPRAMFPSIWAESFPRDSQLLHFRLEERESPENRDWREVTTFVLRNPKPAAIQPWQPQSSPRLNLAQGLEAEIGELTVRQEPIHPKDIWDWLGLLPVRVVQNGIIVTNWGIHSGPVWDASGNLDYFTFSKTITNYWMVYRMFRPLDPTRPWRFRVHFARDSDFPQTNLFSFTVPAALKGTIRTNFDRLPVEIDYVNQTMLRVELASKPADRRVTFVSAFDDDGTNLDDQSGSWGQHQFWRSLKLPAPVQVHATVAIHPDYPAEFTLQPRYEKPPAYPGAGTARRGGRSGQ
jgi:hypothetical protein